MPEINIKRPIRLEMSIAETEDRLPSFSLLTRCHCDEIDGAMDLTLLLWFDARVWDDFVTALKGVETGNGSAILRDMSENFVLYIDSQQETFTFKFNYSRSLMKEPGGKFSYSYHAMIDADAFASIKTSFSDFPRWW